MENKNLLIVIGSIILLVAIIWFLNVTISNKELNNQSNNYFSIQERKKRESEIINNNSIKNMSHLITLKTNKGEIQFTTYDADAPKTVTNFITLARKGFYDGLIFHRIIDGFMIQGGDPTGTGSGGPGYIFDDELNPETESYKAGYLTGVVAMANAGPNTNGSQFFIMVADTALPPNYTIFGKVMVGLDVVQVIAKTTTDANDRPLENIIIEKVTVVENK